MEPDQAAALHAAAESALLTGFTLGTTVAAGLTLGVLVLARLFARAQPLERSTIRSS